MSSELPSVRVICWSNGQPLPSGAGYGVRLSIQDRDDCFDPGWLDVIVSLDQGETVSLALSRSFWRGSYERNSAALGSQMFDADCMLEMMQKTMNTIGQEGNAVVVGRGAPYLLRENPDAFHVFLYAPRSEKIRRIMAEGHSQEDAAEQVDSVDRERIAYVKHYFNADWPTRSLYHVMLNTAVGNEPVVQTILDTMHLVEGRPKATDYERPREPASQR